MCYEFQYILVDSQRKAENRHHLEVILAKQHRITSIQKLKNVHSTNPPPSFSDISSVLKVS